MARKMYFLAYDKANKPDLWVTDGTTTEAVGGVSDLGVADAGPGLGPNNLAIFGQQMIFNGTDSLVGANGNGLWLTDGTAGGTSEVGGANNGVTSSITNASPNGLSPQTIVAFGGKALFFGVDAADFTGLWVSDGTTGGTLELGGLENGGIVGKATNLSPSNFGAFNNSVLFDGYDANGFHGLWISDGTSGGTTELGGLDNQAIFDSSNSNFQATDFITLDARELFDAPSASGDSALWITDGTAQGTKEIGGVNNAGIIGANDTDLGAGLSGAIKFGNRIFFGGSDNDGGVGLWATDGTAAGTTEIGGLDDAGLAGAPINQHPGANGLDPANFAVNGQQLLFAGNDSLGFREMWVTDGTAIGTAEIGGLGDALLSHVAADGLNPQNITPLGNGKAVFIGYDDSNNQNQGKRALWVTDGTTGGTQEIGGLTNQGIQNVDVDGLNPDNDLIGGDGLAYFTGEDSDGNFVLWETDGTTGGTKIVAATDGNGPNQNNGNPNPNPDLVGFNMAMGPAPQPPSAADDLPQDLTNVTYKTSLDAQYNPITNNLHIIDAANNNAILLTIALAGTALAGVLVKLASDGTGGTQVSLIKFPSLRLSSGDQLVSGIVGQPYIGYRAHYIGKLLAEVDYFYQATGQAFQFYEVDCTGVGVPFATKYYYTGVKSLPYTGYEVDYDGGGHLMGLNFTGVKSAAYSSYKVLYNVGIYTGLAFTYTNTPFGATYSSYEVDYDSQNKYSGMKLFYTGVKGQAFTDQEVDIDVTNKLSRVLLSGFTNSGYNRLEQDFTGGVYSGAKLFYDKVVGQTWGAQEIDVNASGILTKVVLSGLTGSPCTALEQDFTVSGSTSTLLDTIYYFGNLKTPAHYQYKVQDDANGNQELWTLDNPDGSHTIIGSTAFQTIHSIGNDKITTGAEFVVVDIAQGCGHETLVDWSSYFDPTPTGPLHINTSDVLQLSKVDFANFNVLSGDAMNVGGKLVITAADGDVITMNNMTTTMLSQAINLAKVQLI